MSQTEIISITIVTGKRDKRGRLRKRGTTILTHVLGYTINTHQPTITVDVKEDGFLKVQPIGPRQWTLTAEGEA